jgi:diguanylate cyclase (GGDEF)-like protein/PAS domain S-box-containing protein
LLQRESDILLTILQTSHGVFSDPRFSSSAFGGSMTLQRKPQARPEVIEEMSKLNDALAVLAAHRRDALLEAVATSAKELLRSANLEQSLPKVIERIGQATGVDRVHILEIDPATLDQGHIVRHHLWSASGISTPPLFKDAKGAAMVDIGLESWLRRLAAGKVVVGHVRDFDKPVREFFESAGVKSAMAVPVFANKHLWGHIGLDDCRDERDWSSAEIDTLKTLAELIGATVSARRHEAILETVATSAKELLRTPNLRQSLPKVMERLGRATGVDRLHLIEIDTGTPPEQSPVVQHYVWSAPGVSSSNYEEIKEPMAEVGLKSWVPRLTRGEAVVGNTRDFEPAARALFERGNVKSVMAVPVFVDDQWSGLIAFDECGFERHWGPAEIDAFKTLAELVGAAVARTRHLKTLADANRIIENSATILYRLDLKPPFPLIFVSQNISRYDYQADELLAHPERWAQLIDPTDLPAMIDDIRSISEGKMDTNQKEFRVWKPDGSIVWFDGHGRALRDGENRLVAVEGILTDITDRKLAAEQIAMLARTDSLTGLPNRAAFLERLNLEFARAKRGANQFAVHYLDLDHFKDVNDTLGHPIGDALLRAVAERLQSCVRETDMVARFGGDEFAVLQDDVEDTADVETLAAKIGETIAAPFAIEGNQVQTTASIGIVPYRGDVATVDVMMMKADLALYRAKNEGRNQFRFHVVELDEQTQERMIIGEELRHAIERGEFELYYQPQVEVKSGSMVGLEALIRWNHPKRGLMLPAAFIAIAETTGSIVSIGEWVIEQACQQIKAWSDLAIAPPTVAVNLSGAQFKLASQLDQIVSENLTRYNIAPERLELELTESVLIETTQRHGETFKRLRKIGVRLAIDDFGTGYSSLDYLRSFRVSRLKIDRRFIIDVTVNADDAAIVRATIGLAHELGIEVIAEGVETAGQRDFLISAGCKLAQGYYFGRPMPTAAASELLRQNFQFSAVEAGNRASTPPRRADGSAEAT